MSYPILGPPWVRSKTCLGLRSHWNFCSNLAPWLPPDLGLMNTNTGVAVEVGRCLTVHNFRGSSFSSSSLGFLVWPFFFLGDFLRLLLKLPLFGSLIIQDGGTMIDECMPISHGSSNFCDEKQVSRLWYAILHQLQLTATISFELKLNFDWNALPQLLHFPFCDRRCTQWWVVGFCWRYWRTLPTWNVGLHSKFKAVTHVVCATTLQAEHFSRWPCFCGRKTELKNSLL